MNKKDFLNELENALEGKLPESDIAEIISDYGDIFDNSVSEEKNEDEVSREIGSPAKIARTILEDGMDRGSRILDKIIEPDRNVKIETLASMARRLGAYVIDSLLLGVVGIGILVVVLTPFLGLVRYSSNAHYAVSSIMPVGMEMMHGAAPRMGFGIVNIGLLLVLFGAFNLFTTIIMWATNGFTPGKYILRMRVVKINGNKLSFLDALLRELIMKFIANSMLSGFLNLGSFVWGCVTNDHKTVHDLVAQTRVIEWNRNTR